MNESTQLKYAKPVLIWPFQVSQLQWGKGDESNRSLGDTEYMERYQSPEELPYAPFTANPQPDYTLPGRPLARLVPESYPSEYMHR